MEFRHLRYFIAVAEHLNFRKAADALHTSQPSLSMQIRALEGELRVQLLERTTRSVKLTETGRFYLEKARGIISELTRANEQTQRLGRSDYDAVVLGGSSATMATYLPAILREFRTQHPNVKLKMQPVHAVGLIAALRNREVQLGFVHAPVNEPTLLTQLLWDHPFSVVLPADHEAARDAAVNLHDLTGERLIAYARTSSATIYDEVTAICSELQFQPGDVEIVTDTSRVMGMVACGNGIAIVPAHWQLIAVPGVEFRPLAPASPRRLRVSACWHSEETSPVIHDLVRIAYDFRCTPPGQTSDSAVIGLSITP